MKTSIVILSSILILSVFLPFLLFVLNGTKNTASTKKHINSLLKDTGVSKIDMSAKNGRKRFLMNLLYALPSIPIGFTP